MNQSAYIESRLTLPLSFCFDFPFKVKGYSSHLGAPFDNTQGRQGQSKFITRTLIDEILIGGDKYENS